MNTPFEGSEKKLEIVSLERNFRMNPHSFWTNVVEAAGAKVLSILNGKEMDAYLLSESSLFVSDHKVLLITCGRTSLIKGAKEIFKWMPFDEMDAFYYERKNEFFPRSQQSHFLDDIKELAIKGETYRFGELDDHHVYLFHSGKPSTFTPGEVTLEILMHGLQGPAQEVLCLEKKDALKSHKKLNLKATLLDDYESNEYFFEPRGYSLNAIKGTSYRTLHVTPEELCSYASFEIGGKLSKDLNDLILKALTLFCPRTFDLFFFSQEPLSLKLGHDYCLKMEMSETLMTGFKAHYMSFVRPEKGPKSAYRL